MEPDLKGLLFRVSFVVHLHALVKGFAYHERWSLRVPILLIDVHPLELVLVPHEAHQSRETEVLNGKF